MESRVLARFKNITFQTDFTWEKKMMIVVYRRHLREMGRENVLDNMAPGLFVGPFVDRVERRSDHVFFYKRSTFIHQLIQVLSKSSDIIRLVVNIDASLILYAIWQWEKPPATRECGLECFLDSGALTPLEKLSNVRSVSSGYDTLKRDALDGSYNLTSDHEEMLCDLEQKIEHNYALRNARASVTAS